jgi:hypothetical protein
LQAPSALSRDKGEQERLWAWSVATTDVDFKVNGKEYTPPSTEAAAAAVEVEAKAV